MAFAFIHMQFAYTNALTIQRRTTLSPSAPNARNNKTKTLNKDHTCILKSATMQVPQTPGSQPRASRSQAAQVWVLCSCWGCKSVTGPPAASWSSAGLSMARPGLPPLADGSPRPPARSHRGLGTWGLLDRFLYLISIPFVVWQTLGT